MALKVVDVDPHDFKVHFLEKDESIQTVLHEIKILTQLRDSNAKNINLIIDAFPIHSQLWIVTEYCPGGSLHTLVSIQSAEAIYDCWINFRVSTRILIEYCLSDARGWLQTRGKVYRPGRP